MALRAGHVRAQEGRHEVRDAVQRHLGVKEHEAGRAVVAQASVGGDHLEDELIPRRIGRDARLEPILEGERRYALAEGVLHAQEVGHPVEHLHGVAGREHEFVDQLGTLVRGVAGQEGRRLLGGRDAAGGVDVDAAQELLVGGGGVEGLLVGGEHGADEAVDVGGGRGDDRGAEAVLTITDDAVARELDVLRDQDVRLEMIGLSIAGLDGDVVARQAAELGVDLLAFLIGPGMPDGGALAQGGYRGRGRRDDLDDGVGGLLAGLLDSGLSRETQEKTGYQGEEAHRGVH